MTSKERVLNALDHKPIDRLPMWYGAEPGLNEKVKRHLGVSSDEQMLQALGADFRTVRPRYIGPALNRNDDGTFDTIWGIRRGGALWGTALNHPLSHVEEVEELLDYPWPDPDQFDVRFTDEDKAPSEKYAIFGGEWALSIMRLKNFWERKNP